MVTRKPSGELDGSYLDSAGNGGSLERCERPVALSQDSNRAAADRAGPSAVLRPDAAATTRPRRRTAARREAMGSKGGSGRSCRFRGPLGKTPIQPSWLMPASRSCAEMGHERVATRPNTALRMQPEGRVSDAWRSYITIATTSKCWLRSRGLAVARAAGSTFETKTFPSPARVSSSSCSRSVAHRTRWAWIASAATHPCSPTRGRWPVEPS